MHLLHVMFNVFEVDVLSFYLPYFATKTNQWVYCAVFVASMHIWMRVFKTMLRWLLDDLLYMLYQYSSPLFYYHIFGLFRHSHFFLSQCIKVLCPAVPIYDRIANTAFQDNLELIHICLALFIICHQNTARQRVVVNFIHLWESWDFKRHHHSSHVRKALTCRQCPRIF